MKIVLCILLAVFVLSNQAQLLDFQSNDINALNYALTLENLEYNFYRTGLEKFSSQNFTDAGYNQSVYNYFGLVRDHEMAHVAALRSAITSRGGLFVQECVYNFTYGDNITAFVALARLFENTGVEAYDGAIDTFTEPGLKTIAATIATVEARHAAYLNELVGLVPFPSSFDNATLPSVIVAAVSPFIVNCSVQLGSTDAPLPVPANFSANVPNNVTAASQNDLNALNYALTLENLISRFYTIALQTFNLTDFTDAGYNDTVYSYFVLIASHELAHRNFINQTILSVGGEAVPECEYNFTAYLSDIQTFINTSRIISNLKVSAYDGVVNKITNLDILTAGATIVTVEARHAAYLNELTGGIPFPDSFDTPLEPSDVINMTTAMFIISCPVPPPVPVVSNYSNATVISGGVGTNLTTSGNNATSTSGTSGTSNSSGTGLPGCTPCVCPGSTGTSSGTSRGTSGGTSGGTSRGTSGGTSGRTSGTGGSSTGTTTGNNGPSTNCPFVDFEDECTMERYTLKDNSFTLNDYDVISFNYFYASTGDVEGRLAVRNGVILGDGYSVGAAVTEVGYTIIARELSWISGALYPEGSTALVREFNGPTYLREKVVDCDDNCELQPVFDGASTCYNNIQSKYGNATDNVEYSVAESAIRLNCTSSSSSRYYITIDAEDFVNTTYYSLVNCNNGAQWIINIAGSGDVVFHGGRFPSPGENVVYNVLGSDRNIVVITGVAGSILAPKNNLYQLGGFVDGKVVVGDASYVVQINKPRCPTNNNNTGTSTSGTSSTSSTSSAPSTSSTSSNPSTSSTSSAPSTSSTSTSSTSSASSTSVTRNENLRDAEIRYVMEPEPDVMDVETNGSSKLYLSIVLIVAYVLGTLA